MNPLRFDNEADYYEILLNKYQQLEQGGLSKDQMHFETMEILSLMKELKEFDTGNIQDTIEKKVMENIVKNMIILLLSLFDNRDQTINYKHYSELSTQEKNQLKEQLLPIASNL